MEDFGRQASQADVRVALTEGGRIVATVRSKDSGKHVTVRLAAKKRGSDGWISRATREGRVGIAEADAVFVDDPTLSWGDPGSRLGTFLPKTGEWRDRRDADPARVWAAKAIVGWSAGDESMRLDRVADVYLASECYVCGKSLTDPESIEDGIGPECKSRRTKSRSVERPKRAAVAA